MDNEVTDLPRKKKPGAPDFAGAGTIGAYNPELSQKAWEGYRKVWWDSPGGRLAIRAFSRGVMGAAFFTAGGLLTRKWMHAGEGEYTGRWGGKYDVTKGFGEQKNPLQFIAKLIDTVVGKPIEIAVRAVTGSEAAAKNAVRFRPTKFKDAEHALWVAAPPGKKPGYYRGRSLGNETVGVTFDFFCMSVGDAMGRDIAGWIDPNVSHKWIKETTDKDGKTHRRVDVPAAVRQMVKSVTRYVTYAGGEDWAVAVPYVYFMKGQRAVLNKFSPGFAHMFDRGLSDSHKIHIDGRGTKIIGNYTKVGAFDLQTRFVAYNMGTLLFREAYRHAGDRLHGRASSLYGDPADKSDAHKTLRQRAAETAKWMARGVVKAGIYMQFAVPFFWITRAPQMKHRGIFLDPKTGESLCFENPISEAKIEAGLASDLKHEVAYANTSRQAVHRESYMGRYAPDPAKGYGGQFREGRSYNSKTHNPVMWEPRFDPHGHTFGAADGVLNAAGQASYRLAHSTDSLADRIQAAVEKNAFVDRTARHAMSLKSGEHFSRFMRPMMHASISYAPYFMAKTEAANLWDTSRMDVASERMIDGAAGLKWGEFKAGAGEVWRAFLHKPFADAAREEAVHRREEAWLKTNTRQKEEGAIWQERIGKKIVKEEAPAYAQADPKPELGWRERTVSGEKPEVGANNPKGHAEREEMREALKNLQPPTNSIN